MPDIQNETDRVETEGKKRGRPKGAKNKSPRVQARLPQGKGEVKPILTGGGNSIRAQALREQRHEDLRAKIQGAELIRQVQSVALTLANDNIEMDAIQVQRLKASADINIRLLDKVLPSLKSIEHRTTHEDILTIDQVPTEQRQAIAHAIEQALGMGGQGGNTDVPDINTTPRPRHQNSEIADADYHDVE
jgi:hypothetical protein